MRITVWGDSPLIDFAMQELGESNVETMLEVVNTQSPQGNARALHTLQPGAYALYASGDAFVLEGDASGCMYGLIDMHQANQAGIAWREGIHTPSIAERGIRMHIPLDARTPSIADASDSAWHNIPHMWEMNFWQSLLDDMARCKFNALVLLNLHPFPSLVRVPGYEKVALSDVCRTKEPVMGATLEGRGLYGRRFAEKLDTVLWMTIDEKIKFFRAVMQHAENRGISVYICAWNVFTYGTEHTDYGIECNTDCVITRDYMKKSVEALVRTYPLLRGIGIAPDAHMSVSDEWIADTFGKGIVDALVGSKRPFRFIQRTSHMKPVADVLQGHGVELRCADYYSKKHMFSDTKPRFMEKAIREMPKDVGIWFIACNDDLYMHRFGGVSYARAYLAGMQDCSAQGFLIGSDGYTLGRDYLSRAEAACRPRRTVFDRQGYMMAIFGGLAYEGQVPDTIFRGVLSARLGISMEEAEQVHALCETVSYVIPLVNALHWHDENSQHYPEANCGVSNADHVAGMGGELTFHDVHDYILTPAQPGTACIGILAYCVMQQNGDAVPVGSITPDSIASQLATLSEHAEQLLQRFQHARGEFAALLADCEGLALLARFYSEKIYTALCTQRAIRFCDRRRAGQAIWHAKEACESYIRYAHHASEHYIPQRLSQMNGRMVDLVALIPQAIKDAEMVGYLMQDYE